MSRIQISPNLDVRLEDLINGLSTALSGAELKEVISKLQLATIKKMKLNTSLLDRESELLKIIEKNSEAPVNYLERRDYLEYRMAERSLTSEEHKEYLEYAEKIEESTTRRLEAIMELSYLKDLPVKQLMDELGLYPK